MCLVKVDIYILCLVFLFAQLLFVDFLYVNWFLGFSKKERRRTKDIIMSYNNSNNSSNNISVAPKYSGTLAKRCNKPESISSHFLPYREIEDWTDG